MVFEAEQAYLDYGAEELELLEEIERLRTGLGKAALLLRSPIGLLVTEPRQDKPNSEQIQIHPLARTTLQQYHFQKLGATA